MSTFTRAPHAVFGKSRASEAVAEIALTVAAAGFTAVMWLSIGAFAVPQAGAAEQQASARSITHVTLPPVVVIGRRNWLDASPAATTTAQNTAAIPGNLRQ
jgi:hypothetical protein